MNTTLAKSFLHACVADLELMQTAPSASVVINVEPKYIPKHKYITIPAPQFVYPS